MASLKDLIVMGPARFLDKLYGNLEGNATTATKLETARTLTLGNSSINFDGSESKTFNLTVSNTWTGGTTAGPTLSTTVNGTTGAAVAIPSASTSASGIVTTGEQSFTGVKKFASTIYANNGLYIGSNPNGDNNFIAFFGTTGDGPGSYNHTVIGENLYGGTEGSELVIFKGNDIDNDSGGSPGPDRIRHIAARHLFQTYDSALSGAWTTICDSTVPITKFEIRPTLISSAVDVSVSGWLRTIGDTGWRSETHGGGWYMSDSTWIRAYNNKKVYVANTNTDAIYTSGGVKALAGFLNVQNGVTTTINSYNSSWTHYQTDSPSGHWFNKSVSVAGNIYAGSSYSDLVLTTANYSGYLDPRYINTAGDTMTGHLYATSGLTWYNANWQPVGNITCTPTANNQEWSIDVGNSTYTGSYFHIWSGKNQVSILQCFVDDNRVVIPNGTLTTSKMLYANGGITGNLTGNASTATAFSSNRTIALSGAITGSASTNGSSGWSIAATIANKAISPTNITTTFRTQTKGDANAGAYFTVIRSDNTDSWGYMPQYGSGIAFGRSDTQTYLYTSYSSANAYIGGGNGDKLNWIKRIAFTDGTGASGTWGISISGSSASCTGNAASATKLQTARAINGTNFDGTAAITTAKWGNSRTITHSGDLSGSFSMDGSANVTNTAYLPYLTCGRNNSNNSYCYHRILHSSATTSWVDTSAILIIHQGNTGGGFGIVKVSFRTNDIATSSGGIEIKWLARYGLNPNCIQGGFYWAANNSYADIYYYTTGTYDGAVIRVLQNRRAGMGSGWTLLNSNASGSGATGTNTDNTNVHTGINYRTYTSTTTSGSEGIIYSSTEPTAPHVGAIWLKPV